MYGLGLDKIGIIFIFIFIMFCLQSLGAFLQVRSYRKAVTRCRKLGTLGFGQKRSHLLNPGHIVIIGTTKDGIITGGEVMKGATVFARFKPLTELLGKPMVGQSIYTYLEELRAMPKKEQKQNKGYIQALESLEMRFLQEKSKEEVEYVKEDEAFDVDDL